MQRVVVIGGGFAGALAAMALQHDFSVTLIDTKNYFEFTPGVPRVLLLPTDSKRLQVPHTRYLSKARVVVDDVVSATATEVRTASASFPFDYLVISSGSSYHSPFKEQDLILASRAEHLAAAAERLDRARRVLVVGGGLVGVEIAAEIAAHDGKDILLVHAHERLMGRMPRRAHDVAVAYLSKRGVSILYNERVVMTGSGSYRTTSGSVLQADIAFLCTGSRPNFSFLALSDALGEGHKLKVEPTLQVIGYRHIFAAGDITAIAEEKTAQNAEKQAEVVVENIRALAGGRALRSYRSRPRIMVMSLGARNGFLTYKDYVLSGWPVALLKRMIEWKTLQRYR